MAATDEAFDAALGREGATWSLTFDRTQAEALRRYAALLLTWSARINLTGAVSTEDLATEHLPDSFALASRLRDGGAAAVVDVGSGGGLPAIPLALLCPELTIQLVEPIAKKSAFLRTAVRELELASRVTVARCRVQEIAPATFDVALSRATFPPRTWLPLAAGLVRPGGRVFLLASVTADWSSLPVPLTVTGQWPYSNGKRWLVELVRAHS